METIILAPDKVEGRKFSPFTAWIHFYPESSSYRQCHRDIPLMPWYKEEHDFNRTSADIGEAYHEPVMVAATNEEQQDSTVKPTDKISTCKENTGLLSNQYCIDGGEEADDLKMYSINDFLHAHMANIEIYHDNVRAGSHAASSSCHATKLMVAAILDGVFTTMKKKETIRQKVLAARGNVPPVTESGALDSIVAIVARFQADVRVSKEKVQGLTSPNQMWDVLAQFTLERLDLLQTRKAQNMVNAKIASLAACQATSANQATSAPGAGDTGEGQPSAAVLEARRELNSLGLGNKRNNKKSGRR